MRIDHFAFYRSYFEILQDLEDCDKIVFLNAICELALNNQLTNLAGFPKTLFKAIKPNILNNRKNIINGLKGGRPKTKTPVKTGDINPPLKPLFETGVKSNKEEEEEKEKEEEEEKETNKQNKIEVNRKEAKEKKPVCLDENIVERTKDYNEIFSNYSKKLTSKVKGFSNDKRNETIRTISE